VVDSGRVLDLPKAGEQVDGVQSGVGISGAWSAGPIASRSCDEERPEDAQTPASFGCSFPCELEPEEGIRGCARLWEGEWDR
jgi:hypothetical protein